MGDWSRTFDEILGKREVALPRTCSGAASFLVEDGTLRWTEYVDFGEAIARELAAGLRPSLGRRTRAGARATVVMILLFARCLHCRNFKDGINRDTVDANAPGCTRQLNQPSHIAGPGARIRLPDVAVDQMHEIRAETGTRRPKIPILSTYQDPVHAQIARDTVAVMYAVGDLFQVTTTSVRSIYVVRSRASIGLLVLKSGIEPIVRKLHAFFDLHDIDDLVLHSTSQAHYPVAHACVLPDMRLAYCQRAPAAEWIGRRRGVHSHNVSIDALGHACCFSKVVSHGIASG